jgi:cytidine deaminase
VRQGVSIAGNSGKTFKTIGCAYEDRSLQATRCANATGLQQVVSDSDNRGAAALTEGSHRRQEIPGKKKGGPRGPPQSFFWIVVS